MPALSPDVVLFLGAGASLPTPAGGPLFAEVRDACAERVGVRTANWPADDARRKLLDHVIPEVFLKVLADAGYRFEAALARAVAGTPGSGPNAVHDFAARLLAAGGTVWTTNWDDWIEDAHERLTGVRPATEVNGTGPPSGGSSYKKLHGTASDPTTLMFQTPQTNPAAQPGLARRACRVLPRQDRLRRRVRRCRRRPVPRAGPGAAGGPRRLLARRRRRRALRTPRAGRLRDVAVPARRPAARPGRAASVWAPSPLVRSRLDGLQSLPRSTRRLRRSLAGRSAAALARPLRSGRPSDRALAHGCSPARTAPGRPRRRP